MSDLAEVAGIVLAAKGHEGRTYELTGPQAISWDDLAQLASSGAGREIVYRSVTDEEYRRYLRAKGLHDVFADGLIALYDAYRSRWASVPDPSLGELLGRQPVDGLSAVSSRLERMTRLLQQR